MGNNPPDGGFSPPEPDPSAANQSPRLTKAPYALRRPKSRYAPQLSLKPNVS